MVSKKAIVLIFLFWFAVFYFVLQFFLFDTLRLYSQINFLQFITKGVFAYFGIPTLYLLIILGLIVFLGILAILSKKARRLILYLAPAQCLLIVGINYILNSETCLSRDCFGRAFGGMLWAGFFWMTFGAILPIIWALRYQITSIFKLFLKTILPGVILILVFVLFWLFSTNPLRIKIFEWRLAGHELKAQSAESEFFPINYAPLVQEKNGKGGEPLYIILTKISESFTGFFYLFTFRR